MEEKMESDFPAAHSMDTRFFVIDRDGRVASFETGENGAVLDGACSEEEVWELIDPTSGLLPSCEVVYVWDGQCVSSIPADERHYDPREEQTVEHCLLFLDSLEPVQAEVTAGSARPVLASAGVAVLLHGLPRETFRNLHKSGLCRGCFMYFGSGDDRDNMSGIGIYQYDHLDDGPGANPYGQLTRPSRPVHIDQLPPEARKLIGRMRLNLSFEETPIIQPVEHGPCVAWGGAYVDATGKVIRPIPGREGSFYSSLYDLDELRKHYQIEEPASEDEEEDE
jgi:hypothetical protein